MILFFESSEGVSEGESSIKEKLFSWIFCSWGKMASVASVKG